MQSLPAGVVRQVVPVGQPVSVGHCLRRHVFEGEPELRFRHVVVAGQSASELHDLATQLPELLQSPRSPR